MVGFFNKTFDDTDTINLVYSKAGFWNHGTWNASNTGQSGTLSTTNILFDGNVTFVFPEPAIGFYYYGIRRSGGGRYGICVDCDQNGLNFETIDAVNITDDGKNPPVLLWSRHFDTPDVHRIILQNQPDTRFLNNNSQITVDRFEIEVVNPNATSVVTITAPQSANPTLPPTSTAATPSALSTISGTNVGAITGGVIGGLVVLLFILTLWYWRWRRRKQQQMNIIGADGLDPTPRQVPFTHQDSMSEIPTTYTVAVTNTKGKHTRGVLRTTNHHGPSPSFGSSSDWTMPTTSSGLRVDAAQRTREMDTGPLDEADGDTLPPEYEQLFRRVSQSTSSGRPACVTNTKQ